jgi:DMSO/TMAO reductase YedYZ molybdopterin-dependent catalytic subunit
MMCRSRLNWLVPFLVMITIAAAAQRQAPAPTPKVILRVGGEVPRELRLTGSDFAGLPRQTVRAKDHQGRDAEFTGVPLVEVLKAAGVKFGQDLRGPALAMYLVVEAADGYSAVFALPEMDPAFTDRIPLLADERDGRPLDEKEGPLRVIVPGEKRHARWVRQVIALRVGRG